MNWKTKTFVIGAIGGLLLGLAASYIVIHRAEQEDTTPKLTPGDGVKVGLGLLGVLRLISDLGDKQ
jgi:hypothetical protein